MRVLMAVHSNYENDARVRREAETLLAAGFEITVVAAWLYSGQTSPAPYHLEGVKVIPIKLKRSAGIGRFAEMMLKMYRMLKTIQTDIIHIHDADTLVPALYAGHPGTPVIYDSHEWYPGNAALVGKPVRRNIWEKIEAYGLSRIHTLITVNESIKKRYKEYFNYEGKSVVLRNFASINVTGKASDTKEMGSDNLVGNLKKEVPNIAIYSGHLTPGRGLPHYLEAIRSNTKWGLVIAGSGISTSWLNSKLETSDLNRRVKYAGMLPLSKLYPLIQQCDAGLCFIEPISESYYYALPNKLSEYVQLGVPVIGSNLPEIASLIRKYNIGYVAESPSLIADCLDKISLGEYNFSDSLDSARDEMSWEKEKHVLVQLYQQLHKLNGPADKKSSTL